jgi:hypothetical protein
MGAMFFDRASNFSWQIDSEDTEFSERGAGEEEEEDLTFAYNQTLLRRNSLGDGQHTLTINIYQYTEHGQTTDSDFQLDSIIVSGGNAVTRSDAPSSTGSSTSTSPSSSGSSQSSNGGNNDDNNNDGHTDNGGNNKK